MSIESSSGGTSNARDAIYGETRQVFYDALEGFAVVLFELARGVNIERVGRADLDVDDGGSSR